MQLNVALAGHMAAWRFHGSTGLENWLHSIPWQNGGGMRVGRIRGASLLPLYSAASRQSVLACDMNRTHVRTLVLTRDTVRRAVADSDSLFLDRLEIPDRDSKFARLVEAARAIERRATVFIVESDAPRIAAEEAAESFLDRIEKAGSVSRPTVLIWTTEDDRASGTWDDFTTGRPVDGLLARESHAITELWRPYLHVRLSWETGGDLDRALRWDRTFDAGNLASGQDGELEKLLNRASHAEFLAVPRDLRESLKKALAAVQSPRRHSEPPAHSLTSMESAGLMWSPDGGPLRPTPWAARALLTTGIRGPLGSQLRCHVVCAWLAREILFASFALEACERARCFSGLPAEHLAPAELRASKSAFEEGRADSARRFYPPPCPAVPQTAWCFASFGQILSNSSARSDSIRRDTQHDLRLLRNSLAHGHYVSWESILALRELQRDLGFVPAD